MDSKFCPSLYEGLMGFRVTLFSGLEPEGEIKDYLYFDILLGHVLLNFGFSPLPSLFHNVCGLKS